MNNFAFCSSVKGFSENKIPFSLIRTSYHRYQSLNHQLTLSRIICKGNGMLAFY